MLAWLLLLILIAVEAGGLTWWLRKEYYPVMFNGWAALIYACALALDFAIASFVSTFVTPGGSVTLQILAYLAIAAAVIIWLFSLFFRWIVKQDINDIPRK